MPRAKDDRDACGTDRLGVRTMAKGRFEDGAIDRTGSGEKIWKVSTKKEHVDWEDFWPRVLGVSEATWQAISLGRKMTKKQWFFSNKYS